MFNLRNFDLRLNALNYQQNEQKLRLLLLFNAAAEFALRNGISFNRTLKMKEPLTTKQQERNEKKKKKLAALANLIQMNDRDRLHEAELARRREALLQSDTNTILSPTNANTLVVCAEGDGDDGFIKISHKRKSKNKTRSPPPGSVEGEPESKRVRHSEGGGDQCISIASGLNLTHDQYKSISVELRRRKRELEGIPTIRLREMGQRASLQTPQEERTPIFLTDIQHLLMAALIGKKSPCVPDRWCLLEKPVSLSHSVVVILEGLSLYHYLSNESKFVNTNRIFNTKLEMVLPPQEDGMIIEEIVQIPLTNVQAQKLIDEHGSLETAVELNKDPTLLVKTIFPIEKTEKSFTTELHPDDKFPRTKLLLSALQMVDEGYPLPLQGQLHNRFQAYMYTKDTYAAVTNKSPMFGVDCEMCRTTANENELTRISIVNERFETVYEAFVRPVNKITDYLTQYSGVTAEMLATVTKRLPEVQKEVRALLPPDAILVGQSLNSDLNAMRMMHPYVIDTSVCFNISGVRKRKSKLKLLAKTFLKEMIQQGDDGHDSIEDSCASLKLVKMKLAHSIEFGDEILMQRKKVHDIIRATSGDSITNNMFAHAAKRDKRTAIVTVGGLKQRLKDVIHKAEQAVPSHDKLKSVLVHEVTSHKEAVRKATEIALDNALTITNLLVPAKDFSLDAADRTITRLDKTIEKLWQSVAHKGLFLVLMGGSPECPNGVAKIAIKHCQNTVGNDVTTTAAAGTFPITV